MRSGPSEVAVQSGSIVHIAADHTFTVYGTDGETAVAILGPRNEMDRALKMVVPSDVRALRIKCGKQTKWTITETVRQRKEVPDNTPLEVGVPIERPPSIHEEMKRFIREEVGRRYAEAEGRGTWDEEDDFDVPDDEELTSPYEFTEMQEEEPLVSGTEEPEPSCPPGEGSDSSTNGQQGREQQESENPPAEPAAT